jgi:N-methylhydantoinase B
MSSRPDPITLGVVWGALQSVAVEVGTTIHRTAYSAQAREGQDFSVAIFDRDGRMTAQGPYSPGHMGAMNFAVLNMLEAFPAESLSPGDVMLLNDPALGSGHLPDFFVTQPAFHNDDLVGFAVNIVHHTDVGGSRPGSQAVEGVFDYQQEGLFIPPTKIVDSGVPNEAVLELIAANSRTPDNIRGDLLAQRNALRVGELRLQDLVERHGLDTYESCIETILDQTEATMRDAVRAIPNGRYEFTDHLDDYGPDTEPLTVQVLVTVDEDSLALDFTGSSPQTESGLNAYLNYTKSYAYAAVKCLTDPYGPMNAGALRPIEISAPEGSFLNPRRPAGGGPRAIICYRVFEVILGALAPALPDRVAAASSHFSNPTWGGFDPQKGSRFVAYELILGGTGARATRDGCEAMSSAFNASNIPVEAQEAVQPIVIERFELMPDSGGPGRQRGGCGVRRDMRIQGEDVKFTNLSERQAFAPFGLFGGEPGALGETVINPGDPSERKVAGKVSMDLANGDVVSFRLSGGGGYGKPSERDPEAVARDVKLGLVGRDAARDRYSVVIGEDGTVDPEATLVARAEPASDISPD